HRPMIVRLKTKNLPEADYEIRWGRYHTQEIALILQTTGDFPEIAMTVTVNLEAYGIYSDLTNYGIIIKNYSENVGVAEALEDAGVVKLIQSFEIGEFDAECYFADLTFKSLEDFLLWSTSR